MSMVCGASHLSVKDPIQFPGRAWRLLIFGDLEARFQVWLAGAVRRHS